MKKLKLITSTLLVTLGLFAFAFVMLNLMNVNIQSVETIKMAPNALADASEAVSNNVDGWKAMAAGIAIGLAALGGTIAMGMSVAKTSEGISRQPEADGKIRSAFMLGLVFIETVVIYALIVGILIIFVL